MCRNTRQLYLKGHHSLLKIPQLHGVNTQCRLLFSYDTGGRHFTMFPITLTLRTRLSQNCPQIHTLRLQIQSKSHPQEADNKAGHASRSCVPSPPRCPGSPNPFPCGLRKGQFNSAYGLHSFLMTRLAFKTPSSFSLQTHSQLSAAKHRLMRWKQILSEEDVVWVSV